jgi:GTP pyrophosphokinase
LLNADEMVKNVSAYLQNTDLSPIKKAFTFATKAHAGQKRKSGEPYVVHPIGVANILTQLRMDVPSIIAGLLHDCVEDTDTTTEELRIMFGPEVAFLVEGVTKLGHLQYRTRREKQAENFRKMLLAMSRDIRVFLIKLSDRLDNMRTLDAMRPDQQQRISRETLDIYAPIANRLGIQWFKTQLEDLSFKYLHPAAFTDLARKVERSERPRRQFIEEVIKVLDEEMEKAGIPGEVQGRPKNLYSIFQKMNKKGRDLDEIHDIVAFRIITSTDKQCYEALGRVHNMFVPIPGRFKDYIALPKQNGYRSLHTSVMWKRDGSARELEVQIRTWDMHQTAEEGIAAHWIYKAGKPLGLKDEKRYSWLRQLMESHHDISDPSEFIENVKIDLFDDEVFVFTPACDVVVLPQGATPVDFAYQIHSEVGNHCSGARVNKVMVPLKYRLKSGDTIEIITSNQQKPNKDWLKFVVTSRARTKIRHYVRKAQRERSRALGRDMLEKHLRKYKLSLPKLEKSKELDEAATQLRLATADELMLQVGFGKVTPAQVLEKLLPEDESKEERAKEASKGVAGFFRRLRKSSSGVQVQGLDDILVRLAKCCNPLPGDPIVGFVTRGRGVTVHVQNCRRALDLDPDRRIDVTWNTKNKNLHPVAIRIHTSNEPGLLAKISKCFSANSVNITQANCRAREEGRAVNTFSFEVCDLDQLKTVVKSIQKIPGVFSVERVQNG